MEKKHIIFALKIFLASVLLGIFAGFLGLNPLGISQEQVIIASYSIFLGLGLITAILTFYFTRKSHQAYQKYQREEEDEGNEQDYLATYRFLDYATVAWNVCQISMLSCLLLDLGGLGKSVAPILLMVVGIWSGVYCLKITSKVRNYKLSIDLIQGQSAPHSCYLCCLSRVISSIGTSTVGCSAGGSGHPFVHECCTVAQNKTLFQIGEYYENT